MRPTHFALGGSTFTLLMLATLMLATVASLHGSSLDVGVKAVATSDDGTKIDQYTMTNCHGMQVSVITYGATITSVRVPDRDGKLDNVTLHFDDPALYLQGHPLFGSVVGRYANRIANAQFVIDGTKYLLTANAGKNHIHGGRQGFQRLVWSASPLREENRVGVVLTHVSEDGHAGYPGNLNAKVQYALTNNNELVLEYWATTDKPTHVNLTNHTYWNLGGVKSGNVLNHVMTINATQYLEANAQRFPSGKLLPVADSPMDFRTPHTIGSRIEQLESKNYDDCYVIDRPGAGCVFAARAEDASSGRVMEVYTTTPGVQFYTAKGLNGQLGVKGTSYGPYHGFCLETQCFPDSPNQPAFPSTLLRPGQTYHQKTVHTFSVAQ